jgi:hypothetical protein
MSPVIEDFNQEMLSILGIITVKVVSLSNPSLLAVNVPP